MEIAVFLYVKDDLRCLKLVNCERSMKMKKILIPIDEKENVKTMEAAKDLALKFDSELVLLHVKTEVRK